MTTTDPKELVLMERVADLSIAFEDASASDCQRLLNARNQAVIDLRDYRTRSIPPDPVPLLPCPFCGGEPELYTGDIRYSEVARCTVCSAQTPGVRRGDAAEDWNRRAHSPCKPDTRIEPTDEPIQQADVAAYIGHAVALLDGIAELDDAESQRDLANAISLLGTAKARCDRFTPPSRIEVSEEAMEEFLNQEGWRNAGPSIEHVVRKALAHFSPTQPAQEPDAPLYSYTESGAFVDHLEEWARDQEDHLNASMGVDRDVEHFGNLADEPAAELPEGWSGPVDCRPLDVLMREEADRQASILAQPAPVQQGPISAESEAELSGACIGEIRKHVREGLGFSTAFADDGVLFAVGLAQRAVLAGLMSDAQPDMQRRCSEAAERYRTLHEEEIGYPILPARPATPTITKDQWEEIRKLAISNAPEAFPYGVAKVLGRAS